jgi:hypothetical protein
MLSPVSYLSSTFSTTIIGATLTDSTLENLLTESLLLLVKLSIFDIKPGSFWDLDDRSPFYSISIGNTLVSPLLWLLPLFIEGSYISPTPVDYLWVWKVSFYLKNENFSLKEILAFCTTKFLFSGSKSWFVW